MLRTLFNLPSESTLVRALRRLRCQPGISRQHINSMSLKLPSEAGREKFIFLLMEEMSIKKGLRYDQISESIIGFTDDGSERTVKLATSALSISVCGVVKRWSHPIGFFLTESSMKSQFIIDVIQKAIALLEEAGYTLLGLTTDQGSNFE